MNWVLANLGLILDRMIAHLWLAAPAILAALVVSLPIGWAARRHRWSRAVVLSAAGLLYAIPSLPLFILLPTVIGTAVRDRLNVVAALTLYGIALMVRSVADALDSVDPDVEQAATAMGYAPWARFWAVDLPLAGPVLLAGLRVVAVSTISLVTVSAVLGVNSLGMLFIDGFQRGILAEVVAGILATALLALAVDFGLVLAGRVLLPWTRQRPLKLLPEEPAAQPGGTPASGAER